MKAALTPAQEERAQAMKERARLARRAASQAAKEHRKNDPKQIAMKEKLKQARRAAAAEAKERRKTDPKQIAMKEKLKKDRQAQNLRMKAMRKAAGGAARRSRGEGSRDPSEGESFE